MAAEPRVGTAGSVSIIETCHHAVPLWEMHHVVGLEMTRSMCFFTCYPPPAKQNLSRSMGEETQGSSRLRMLGPHRSLEA